MLLRPEAILVATTALASAACYALALVLAQIGLRNQSVLASATVSLPITALVFWGVAVFRLHPSEVATRALLIFAATGLVFPVSVTILSYQGNRLLGPNLAGALGNATPVFAVAFGVLILGDHLTGQRALGLAAVVGGVLLLSLRRGGSSVTWPAAALLVPLAAAAVRGLVQPVMKLGLAITPDPLAATVVSYTMSALVILVVAWGRGRSRWPVLQPRSAPIFVAVGVLNGASVLLLYTALTHGQVSLVAPLVASYPLMTIGFSALLLRGEPIHLRLGLGILATVAGVALILAS